MLIVNLNVNRIDDIGEIKIVRGEQHPRYKKPHYWYSYQATDDRGNFYKGKVLHGYDKGAFALVQKVTKAIVSTQKEERLK